MKKVALHNLGCKVNAYETEAMQEMLEHAGYEIVPFQEGADIYVINTWIDHLLFSLCLHITAGCDHNSIRIHLSCPMQHLS